MAGVGARVPLRLVLAASLSILFPLIVILTVNRDLAVAYGLMAAIGACLIVRTAGLQTLLQLTVKDEMRGRAMGIYLLLIRCGTGLGALLIGLASDWLGLALAIGVAAVVGGGTILVFVLRNKSVWRELRTR
jgi:predicted MFS family arabinose efflux permease